MCRDLDLLGKGGSCNILYVAGLCNAKSHAQVGQRTQELDALHDVPAHVMYQRQDAGYDPLLTCLLWPTSEKLTSLNLDVDEL